jgi:cohesin complex subunit SA-1/2
MEDAFLKIGDKDPLRACVKAINFCCVESRGELHDFARIKLKLIRTQMSCFLLLSDLVGET